MTSWRIIGMVFGTITGAAFGLYHDILGCGGAILAAILAIVLARLCAPMAQERDRQTLRSMAAGATIFGALAALVKASGYEGAGRTVTGIVVWVVLGAMLGYWLQKTRAAKRSKRLWAGITMLGILAVLYLGHCVGLWGKNDDLLRYAFQCSCPRFLENIRYRWHYSRQAEILFPACASGGPVPSPSGQKVAVIKSKQSYVWFLQTGERIPFTWLGSDLDWITDDLLFVRKGLSMNVVDLGAGVEYPLPKRTNVRLVNGEITPDVLSALREAGYVILTRRMVAAIAPEALASPERSFIILYYDEFAHILAGSKNDIEKFERMRQFLRDQDIDYLDYIVRDGTDVLSINRYQKYGEEPGLFVDLVSPDERFFYRESFFKHSEDGIYLVETGEKIVDGIPNWLPVDWVYDGVIIRRIGGGEYLIDLFPDWAPIELCPISEPKLKLRVPAKY